MKPQYVYVASSWRNSMQTAVCALEVQEPADATVAPSPTADIGRPTFRPVSDDPSAPFVAEMFDVGAEWLLAASGEYQTAAVETMTMDGSNWQEVVAIEIGFVRMFVSPEQALDVAESLTATARWMLARRS